MRTDVEHETSGCVWTKVLEKRGRCRIVLYTKVDGLHQLIQRLPYIQWVIADSPAPFYAYTNGNNLPFAYWTIQPCGSTIRLDLFSSSARYTALTLALRVKDNKMGSGFGCPLDSRPARPLLICLRQPETEAAVNRTTRATSELKSYSEIIVEPIVGMPSMALGIESGTTGSTCFLHLGQLSRWMVCSVTAGSISSGMSSMVRVRFR